MATFHLGPISSNRLELFLNSTFKVKSVLVGGASTTFRWSDPERKLPYVNVARLLVVDVPKSAKAAHEVTVSYSGRVPETIAGVNVIRPDLVELALYAAWYPVHAEEAKRKPFVFSLDLEIPDSYQSVSRGKRTDIHKKAGWRFERWRTSTKASDIVVFASNSTKRLSEKVGATEVSLSYRTMADKDARDLLRHAVEGFKYFTTWLGKTSAPSLQIINSPRGGWGYSRPGFILMSEQRAIERIATRDKIEPRFRLVKSQAHEMAHLWWSWVGDPSTSNDWINEALAEYSSAKDALRRGGKKELRALLDSYLDSIRQANPPVGILKTRSSDKFRGANWYHKGGLFFLCLERRIGVPAMKKLLTAFLRWRGTGEMTTAKFDDIMKETVGKDLKWVATWLRTTNLIPVEKCVEGFEKN